jgi:hypothetical protein
MDLWDDAEMVEAFRHGAGEGILWLSMTLWPHSRRAWNE